MDSYRKKRAAAWLYSKTYRDEALPRRAAPAKPALPPLLRTARALQTGPGCMWQSRQITFLKQGRLLANYEDETIYTEPVLHYYPTYESLTDEELRGYFGWRTRLRRGEVSRTSLTYAYLYLYELINGIGCTDAMDGYQKLLAFRDSYGALDADILLHLKLWLFDYVIYYDLPPALIADNRLTQQHRYAAFFSRLPDHSPAEILEVVHAFSPKWLSRSRFYAEHREDMDKVIVPVLLGVWHHYDLRCKKTMTEQYFGTCTEIPVYLFQHAVFHDGNPNRTADYTINEDCVYHCRNGHWSTLRYQASKPANRRLEELMKTIDSILREEFLYNHPIKRDVDTKWLIALIRQEIQHLQEEKQAEEAAVITIDYGALAQIRQEAAATRDKLIVDEETDEPPQTLSPVTDSAPAPDAEASAPNEGFSPPAGLSEPQYRLLQCLLDHRDISWVQAEGHLLSVLADGINEALYDDFCDSVLTMDDHPQVIADYIDDLKEMIHR